MKGSFQSSRSRAERSPRNLHREAAGFSVQMTGPLPPSRSRAETPPRNLHREAAGFSVQMTAPDRKQFVVLRGSRPRSAASLHLGVGAFSPPPANFKDQPRRTDNCTSQYHCLNWQEYQGLWTERHLAGIKRTAGSHPAKCLSGQRPHYAVSANRCGQL